MLDCDLLLNSIVTCVDEVMIYSVDFDLKLIYFSEHFKKHAKDNFLVDLYENIDLNNIFKDKKHFAFMKYNIMKSFSGDRFQYEDSYNSKHFINHFNPVYDKDKKIIAVTIILKDITKIKKREEELEYSYYFFQQLIDALPIPIFYKNEKFLYKGCNRAFEEYYEVTRDNLIGRSAYQITSYETATLYTETDYKLLKTQIPQIYEADVNINGTIRNMLFYKALFYKMDGEIGGIVGSIVDISDLKKKDNELNNLLNVLKQLEVIVNNSPAIAFLWKNDSDWSVEYVSENIKLFGYSTKEFYNKEIKFADIIYKDDLKKVMNEVKYYSENKCKEYVQEYRITTKTKEIKWIHDHTFVRYNEQKEITHYQGIITDITDHKIIENKLRISQKMEAIGTIASGIAHEINSPMQYILDNTLFLQKSFDKIIKYLNSSEINNDCSKECIDDIDFLKEEIPLSFSDTLEGIERVRKIISAMKDFAHTSLNNHKTFSDINRGIESTVVITKNVWKYNCELLTDLATDLPLVFCNIDDINQVVLNLITNASDAIEEAKSIKNYEKGIIKIKTYSKDNNVIIEIEDNGSGIDDSIKENIFNPFFTTKDVGKGSGQGLAISHGIMENHKGSITFESQKGEFTKFIITLPINEIVEEEDKQ